MKGFKKYSEYKASGVEWLGDVPEHWEVKKLKYLVKEKLKYGANESAELDDPSLPRYIRITDFGDDGKLRDDTFKSLPQDKAKEYLLEEGDILFARSGATVGKTFQFKNYNGIACFAGYLIKASPDKDKILSDFVYYYTKSTAYDNWKNSIFIQATIQNIGADKYQTLLVTRPSLDEQQAIADFLDRRTGQIDELIAKKERVIELLREKRTAIISHAVTKGLNPDARMKDSGIDWLGEIPEHWEVSSLRRYFRVKSGDMTSPSDLLDEGYQVFGGNGFRGFTDKWNTEANTIIIGRYGALCGNVRITRNRIWATEHAFRVFSLLRFHTDYFARLLHALDLNKFSARAAQPGLNSNLVRNNVVGVPPIREQEAIADFLDRETSWIDALIAKVTEAIEKLKEYRTALISTTVTGKIDVRREAN